MILDGHIHITKRETDTAEFEKRLKQVGVGGGVVLSLPPGGFWVEEHIPARERLDNLLLWTESREGLYPFFWINPLEADAEAQVAMAVQRGVMGFKVICDEFFPGDKRALKVFNAIAGAGKPILFHTGILWDGKHSAQYNRPGNFEALLEVQGLRFCLAHVGWPWCDEFIAVYGKFLNSYTLNRNLSVEMFIDTTPGTPALYRREVLTKLFTVGYDVEHNVIFGSDSSTNDYNCKWVEEWVSRDQAIFRELGLDQKVHQQVFGDNLKRFVGVSSERVEKTLPRMGE